jgi:hypothetical protein
MEANTAVFDPSANGSGWLLARAWDVSTGLACTGLSISISSSESDPTSVTETLIFFSCCRSFWGVSRKPLLPLGGSHGEEGHTFPRIPYCASHSLPNLASHREASAGYCVLTSAMGLTWTRFLPCRFSQYWT